MADRIGIFGDEFFGDGVGLIFILTFFVLNDAALEIEFFLIEDGEQMAHAIAFGEENVVEHGGGNVFEIVGAIVVGGAVEVGGADAFHGVDVVTLKFWLPLNMRCSKRWAKPVLPVFSFLEPT